MFIGEHRHNLDEKGRLQIPVKWRSALAEGAVVTKGFDGSLNCYPKKAWEEIAAGLAQLPQSQPSVRAYVRQVLAGAVDVELDKLGRVVVPSYLREYAKLGKQVVIAGLHDHMELWDNDTWESYVASIDPQSPELSQALQELGI